MGRHLPPLSSGSPLNEFAADLRALRDRASVAAASVDELVTSYGVAASTVYAALNGKRLPSRKTLAKIVTAWEGDQAEWMAHRSRTESALHTRAHVNSSTDERHEDVAVRQALYELESITPAYPATPYLTRRTWSALRFAATLKVLRTSAGNSSLRELAIRSGVSRSSLSEILSGHRVPSAETGNRIITALESEASSGRADSDSIEYLARTAMRYLIHSQQGHLPPE